ncbi:hypothetical protein Tco_0490540 [Tanacetum coccineum]
MSGPAVQQLERCTTEKRTAKSVLREACPTRANRRLGLVIVDGGVGCSGLGGGVEWERALEPVVTNGLKTVNRDHSVYKYIEDDGLVEVKSSNADDLSIVENLSAEKVQVFHCNWD